MTLAGLAVRNVLRNKFRAVLTVMGVAVAILTFMLLRTVIYAWTAGADYAAKDRIVTRHKVTFVMQLPKRYVDDVKRTPGVKAVTWANWFGGKDPKHDKEFFGTIAVDAPTMFEVYDELQVDEAQKKAFVEDRSGAVVGKVLADKMGWKVGQKVTLISGIYKGEWAFTIRAIYTATKKSIDQSTFFFHWALLNESLDGRRKDEVGWIVSRVSEPGKSADLSVALDKGFEEREVQTLSQDERAFNASFLAMFSSVLNAIDLISLIIVVIMLLILGNTIAMGVRERTSEYAMLRAIGFRPVHVAGFVLGESLVLGLIGGGLGIAISYPIVQGGMGGWIEANLGSMFPYFRINPTTTVVAIGVALGLALVAAIIPATRAASLRVVDALRRVA